mgnify:CR=1 FL=1
MQFYQTCLGGELSFQTIGESPLASQIPASMRHLVLHAALVNGALVMMGTDMMGEAGLIRGNAISMCLNCGSEAEMRHLYGLLSVGGQAIHSIHQTFSGGLFGNLTDKFGNHWLLYFDQHPSS